ncbi:MAG: tryptophan 2,3-dioxygenase family protein [Thaumarchaeota archaeon]|nr:tryptophan 2,3-dioxygenase family protein [Nitrososphaerota archaeon]
MPRRKPLSYGDYLGLDELLGLQRLVSKPRQHDEVLFVIAHQTYELWFKLMLNELESAISNMISGDLSEPTRLIRRVVTVQRVLIEQLEVLETIRPIDFVKFRSILNPASGFQSLQFRELEFISGLKDKRYIELHKGDESSYEQLLKRWDAPTLWDAFKTVLEQKGLLREPTKPRKRSRAPDEVVPQKEVEAVVEIFSEQKHTQLAELAEALMEYDKYFWLWRNHHLAMVERVIGGRKGTGAGVVKKTLGPYSFDPSGAAYLETTLSKRFFPVLWAARTRIHGR